MEAYLRAKQLGGDEARVIMLCNLGDVQRQNLEKALKDDMGSKDEPLQVWGKNTWTGLSDKLKKYLNSLYWKPRGLTLKEDSCQLLVMQVNTL